MKGLTSPLAFRSALLGAARTELAATLPADKASLLATPTAVLVGPAARAAAGAWKTKDSAEKATKIGLRDLPKSGRIPAGKALEFDPADMQVGETRRIEFRDGRHLEITRTEEGVKWREFAPVVRFVQPKAKITAEEAAAFKANRISS